MTDGRLRLTRAQAQMLLVATVAAAGGRLRPALDYDDFDPPPAPPKLDVPGVVAWYRQREAERKARKRRR